MCKGFGGLSGNLARSPGPRAPAPRVPSELGVFLFPCLAMAFTMFWEGLLKSSIGLVAGRFAKVVCDKSSNFGSGRVEEVICDKSSNFGSGRLAEIV